MENISKKIAFGGILLALDAILFMLINFVPINTIFFMALASLISSIVVIEFGEKMGTIFTLASIFISFIIIANKAQWFVFAISFAVYGIVKSLIERGRNMVVEYSMKIVFANLVLFIIYSVLKSFIQIKFISVLVVGFNIVFLIFDLFYSQFINMYQNKWRKNISKYLD